jgi:hypothetical protein
MEPATFRRVAQCLNQLRYGEPQSKTELLRQKFAAFRSEILYPTFHLLDVKTNSKI